MMKAKKEVNSSSVFTMSQSFTYCLWTNCDRIFTNEAIEAQREVKGL